MRNQVGILALLTFLTIVLTPLPLNLWTSLSTAQVLAQTSSEKKAEADRLLGEGVKKFQANQFEAALQPSQQALTLYQQIKDRRGEEQALKLVGLVYKGLEKPYQAFQYHQQYFTIVSELKDEDEVVSGLVLLGLESYSLGAYGL